MWLIILLVFIGIILMTAELVILPGISMAGAGALVIYTIAVILAFVWYGVIAGVICLVGVVAVSTIAVVLSLRSGLWRKLRSDKVKNFRHYISSRHYNIKIGDKGYALTCLAPVGKVIILGRTIEAKSIGDFIDEKSQVEVVGYDDTNIVVKRY